MGTPGLRLRVESNMIPSAYRHALPDLGRQLQQLLSQIPYGRATTYGDLATALGDRRASRWVGEFLLDHRHTECCNCHRVVRADGSVGQYFSGNPSDKPQRLRAEGVPWQGDHIDLTQARFARFEGPRPLTELRERQVQLSSRVRLQPAQRLESVAGVDVSYRQGQAFAAYVEFTAPTAAPVATRLLRLPAVFPYIPTYLAFRELDVLQELLHQIAQERPLPDVLLVDGSGIAHPRRTGIATMLGILIDLPTIGVTKRHLFGQVAEEGAGHPGSHRLLDPESHAVMGATLPPAGRSRRPLFVSPGHGLTVDQAVAVVVRWQGRRRLPEPIFWADRESRAAASRFTP